VSDEPRRWRAFARAPPPGGDRTLDDLRVEEAVARARALATKQKEAEAAVKARARDYVDAQSRRQRAYEAPENLVPVGLDAQPRRRIVPKQVDGKWLARLDALRDRVPWAPGAALLVDGAPDAKGYTPFTLPDAKGALAATVAGLLGATDVAFGVVES